ncbi:MAG: MATE family efflux transporter [Clostridia bacterium]|nr:MATE family efflux transporter [Clostridia bacterium]
MNHLSVSTRKTSAFPWKTFLKSVLIIAVPVAFQNLLTTTGSMIDTIMLAALGEQTVGAVGLCAQFSSLMFSCYWGFVGGGMLFFSQYFGAKDDRGIDRSYETTLIFMLAVSFLFAFLACFAPSAVMRMYTDKESLSAIGIEYLKIVGFAYPLQIVSTAMSALLRSTDKVRIPLIAGFASTFTNMGINYCLISGHLGFPALGVRGAAIATVIAAAVNMIVLIVLAQAQHYPYLFHFFRNLRLSRAWIAEYLRKCFPIILNELFVGIGFAVTNIVLGRQAEEAIAALAVFRTLEGFVISFFAGFSNASSILVGQKVGAGDLRDAYEHARRLILLCGICIACVCAVLFALHAPLLSVMSLSGKSFEIGTQFVGIYCVAAVIRMCNWAQTDTFRASGDAQFGSIVEISFMYALVIPAVILSRLVFRLPGCWVLFSSHIDEPIRLVIMQRHMYSGKWIKPVTPQGKAALPAFFEKLHEDHRRSTQK